MTAKLYFRVAARRAAAVSAMVLVAGGLLPTGAQKSSKERVEAFAKLPNWSGIWELDAFVGQSDGQQFSAEGQRRLKYYAAALRPAFTPEYQSKFNAILKKVQAAVAADPNHSPETHPPLCDDPPFPATLTPGMFEWLVTPEETTFVSTVGAVRHIYTDGRSHPPKDELWPTLMGDSVGHWEGDTLVIDTVSTKPRLYTGQLSGFFFPMSDQMHFIERVRMIDHDHMQIDYMVEDPKALTRPMHATIIHSRVTDFNRMIEETDCEENERDPVVDGRFTTVTH